MILLEEKLLNMTSLINVLIENSSTVHQRLNGCGTNPWYFLPDAQQFYELN